MEYLEAQLKKYFIYLLNSYETELTNLENKKTEYGEQYDIYKDNLTKCIALTKVSV